MYSRVPVQSLNPRAIQIDASSHCQLACPVCPTALGWTRPVLGAGHLKVADFERLLEANPDIRQVELSNYGEMFLNPHLPELLACAYERKVAISARNGVNLNFASDAALEAVVKYRVSALTCSIDGASQETYSRYRVNGQLERVLANVDQIRCLRRVSGSAFPLLDWQFVVMGHNEHEIEAARAMASARGMNFFPRLSWNADHSPVVNGELVRIQTGFGAASRQEYREKKGAEYTRDICFQLWHAPVINWDGKMLGCCANYWGDFGSNVFHDGLEAAMHHPKAEYARQMLAGKAEPRPDIPCTTCDQYHAFRQTGAWITEKELSHHGQAEILVGTVLTTNTASKFARISVTRGDAAVRQMGASGTLFRFGVDTAVYFNAPACGRYTLSVQRLEARGWGAISRHTVEVVDRPACQEFKVDVGGNSDTGQFVSQPLVLPFSIR